MKTPPSSTLQVLHGTGCNKFQDASSLTGSSRNDSSRAVVSLQTVSVFRTPNLGTGKHVWNGLEKLSSIPMKENQVRNDGII